MWVEFVDGSLLAPGPNISKFQFDLERTASLFHTDFNCHLCQFNRIVKSFIKLKIFLTWCN